MRLFLLPLLLILLPACSAFQSAMEEDLPPSNLPVTFAEAPYETSFAVEGGAGVIVVQDRAITGICHRHENRGAYREDGVVTLWIAHTGNEGEVCPLVGRMVPYRATISGLEPGTYRLRVEYIGQIQTDTYPRPDLEQDVTVR
jgi:hypothetical protein